MRNCIKILSLFRTQKLYRMGNKIMYADVMALGFTQEAGNDSVFESIHGYPYTIFTKNLTKCIYIDWQQDTRLCELIRFDPGNGDIFARMPLEGLEQLKNLIAFYTDDLQ